MRIALAVVIVVVVCVGLALLARASDTATKFRVVAPGVEAAVSVVDDVTVLAWRIDLKKRSARVVPASTTNGRQTVAEIATAVGAIVATNASFFDKDGAPMGLVVDDVGRHGAARQEWGALIIDKAGARIVPGKRAASSSVGAFAVVQGVPRLLVDGAVVAGLKEQSFVRTAVCAEGSRLVLVVTRGAIDAAVFAAHLRDRLGCRFALNLDGGPSTQARVRTGNAADDVDVLGWGVPNALVVR